MGESYDWKNQNENYGLGSFNGKNVYLQGTISLGRHYGEIWRYREI